MTANARLYHLTDVSRLASIAERGLDPSHSREPDFRDRACYLSGDAGHAAAYEGHHGDWDGGGVLLAVDVSRLDPALLVADDVDLPDILDDGREPDEVGWEESLLLSGQCRYVGVIPVDVLVVVDPDTGMETHLRDAVGASGPKP